MKNLKDRKPGWGHDNYQQLPHKASILQLCDQTIGNAVSTADHASIFFMRFKSVPPTAGLNLNNETFSFKKLVSILGHRLVGCLSKCS